MIQLLIDSIENQLGIIEAEQQRAGAALFLRWQQMMPTGNRARSFAKSLRAQYLTANRTNQFFAGCSIAGTAK
ncbi:MAG TPA: hypothetical protein VHT23_10135 [Gemmatimonadaceae bacterium]|nr:hypothetical protein [Gemmatimonadaceae bacterium]